ncbi:MAG TPA: phenylalanine--tRNA ligase subunit beta, partial [Terrimesophilobacter sp.]|nr:phenylalanine--tRNA ligase subunit beta [Terrimesophilobacter sp.]
MRVPVSWLREFVDAPKTLAPDELHAALVRVGLEEEAIHSFGLEGPIVVGQVLEFVDEPQSNGKTIRWCQVDVGESEPRGIVCGAQNFVVGDKVVVTLPGSVLPGPFPIAARKTYGHVSDGMIASARELGLGDEHDGILRLAELGLDAEVGTDALPLLGLDDWAVEVNITPDRGYALSIRGIAREYSHATGATFRDPALAVAPPSRRPSASSGSEPAPLPERRPEALEGGRG